MARKPKKTREETLLPVLRKNLQAKIDEYNAGKQRWPPYENADCLIREFPKWSRKDFMWAMQRMNVEGLCSQGSGRQRDWWSLNVNLRDERREVEDVDDTPLRPAKVGGAAFVWHEAPVPKKKRYSKRLGRRIV